MTTEIRRSIIVTLVAIGLWDLISGSYADLGFLMAVISVVAELRGDSCGSSGL